ncbi:DNA helicase [Deltaproteobacteria bacterium]|nr:DNA helicase [Deltaproteobacteria bacterium]
MSGLFEYPATAEAIGPEAGDRLDLAARLNPSQLAAATYEGGPLLIVAGAGSGKTRTLVHRVAGLVDRGVPPRAILLLTFTRKAAQEMLGRAMALAGRRAGQVSGGTFHALANALLRPLAHLLGYPTGFTILDQDDAETLIARIRNDLPEVRKHKRFPQKGAILNLLSQAVNKDRPLLEILADNFAHFLDYAPLLEKIGLEYRAHKLKNALMDFDDLLVGLETVLQNHEEVRLRLAARYDYILVDEYQDTNPIQARLTHLLGRDHLRVTAVGDEAQSIYAFRGASFRNIMDFPKIFPGTKILKLEENYRSQEPIVALANHLIAQAREKYDKTLVAVRGAGRPPQMVAVQDLADEAGTVAARIEELLADGLNLKDIAVLFRASAHSFDLEVELVRRRLPYTKYGGRKFLEAAHIKDFLAFLRVAANPADGLALRRVLTLLEGVGLKGADEVAAWLDGRRDRLLDLGSAPLKGRAGKALAPLAELLARIAQEGNELTPRARSVAEFYLPRLRDLYPDDWPDRQADLKELLRMAEERDNLRLFLDELTLDPPNQKRIDPEERKETLTLSTVHSAKGLEWKAVFILSAVEGRFPPAYAARSAAEVEEERRLMYVAVTRAEDHLFIMLPLGTFDHRTGALAAPSRFLAALPPEAGLGFQSHGRDQAPAEARAWLHQGPAQAGGHYSPVARPAGPGTGSGGRPVPPGTGANFLTETETGQRVSHPIYGAGRVTEVRESRAVIDFDLFGKKNVIIAYAKLVKI